MMRRRALLAAAAAAAVAVGGAVLLLDGDDEPAALPTIESLPEAGLPDARGGAADELEALLEGADGARVHAVFESQGDTSQLGGDVVIELWRDGDRTRYDNRLATDDGESLTSVYLGGDSATVCTSIDGADPTCSQESGVDVAAARTLGIDLSGQLDTVDREVGGEDARCFRTAEAELCVDGDGVPLLLTIGDARLVRVTRDDAVTAADLTPPVA